ncbi:hypothetical protein C8Q72DRAFT_950463, partial [Fomitopsis betulina]
MAAAARGVLLSWFGTASASPHLPPSSTSTLHLSQPSASARSPSAAARRSTCHDPPHLRSTPAVALRSPLLRGRSGSRASTTCETSCAGLHPPRPCTCRDRPHSRAAPA